MLERGYEERTTPKTGPLRVLLVYVVGIVTGAAIAAAGWIVGWETKCN